MKTKNLLTIISAVAFAVITININASDALLSPHAKGLQITKVSGVNNDPNLVAASRDTLLSPHQSSLETKRTPAVEDVAAVKCPVVGSPKYIDAVGTSARTSCCNLTLAQCATMDKMPN